MCYFLILPSKYGGARNQSFRPLIRVFHAELPRGSLWGALPDLSGPIRSHLLQT